MLARAVVEVVLVIRSLREVVLRAMQEVVEQVDMQDAVVEE
jgi:hypothetical protein